VERRTRTLSRRVTSQIGLSDRRFTQVFSGEVGLTPKLFCRIRRFAASRKGNPTTYLAQRTEHLNHVPILD